MKNTKNIEDNSDLGNEEEGWSVLGEDEGEGGECCGKNMVELMCTYTCLKCGNWEYSSS